MNWIVRALMKLASPFKLGHIYGTDGSLYMSRYGLFETKYLSMRLHHIAREDMDRHMHDHPWNFLSVVLQGGYVEARPTDPEKPVWIGDQEIAASLKWRLPGRCAYRRATDRHRIIAIKPDTWTLFITGVYRNQWGFFVPGRKVPYREYLGLPPKHVGEP